MTRGKSGTRIKTAGLMILAVLVCLGSSAAWGDTYTYRFWPNPPDMYDLPHSRYFAWGIDWASRLNPVENEVITDAKLIIYSINDWTVEDGDVLHLWLLDELPDVDWAYEAWPGLSVGRDLDDGDDDAFDSSGGTHIGDWHDDGSGQWNPNGPVPEGQSETLVIPIPVAPLQSYVANDNMFGIGADPDCHYYNCGFKLKITTEDGPTGQPVIPEPVTMLGVLSGMGGVGVYLKRRRGAGRKEAEG